jgi:proline iminopeptidase
MTPDEFTNQELMLDVGDGHHLYVQDWGNKSAATPILFLHGGPGGRVKDKHKASFNPAVQRVIFHDQRGCGNSLPYGSLENNTTQKLVLDIEKIATKLNVDKFLITGGSWGSCLALAYALEYPERVKAMVLNGIFTGSKKETEWLDQGRFQTFFPDVWQAFLETVPEDERTDPVDYHYNQVMSGDENRRKASAKAFENLEGALIKLDDRFVVSQPDEEYDPSGIRLEMHYTHNLCFMADRHILKNAHKLKMPIWLLQGRYDMVCPPQTAYELSKKLSRGKLIWTINGHAAEHEGATLNRILLEQFDGEGDA